MESAKEEEPLVADLLRRHGELQQEAVAASMPSQATQVASRPSEDSSGFGGFLSRLARPDNQAASGMPSSMTL